MNSLRIYICFPFKNGPWGGANQFLKALRNYFKKMAIYSENLEDADVILFNSHHYLKDIFFYKKKYPNKFLIHRIDGPVSQIRGNDRIIDELIFSFNEILSDGTIFQSNWSKKENHKLGMKKSPYEITIINAPDPYVFNKVGKEPFDANKIKIVTTSWSANIRKGFDIYKFLDEKLDFDKYKMTFVGNTPIEFKNIKWIRPVVGSELANILRQHDIFIIASRKDPCSNALIEALHCGLPVVAINDGGHPEIVRNAGKLFEDKYDVIDAIDEVAQNYGDYQIKINLPTIEEVAQKYYEFAKVIYNEIINKKYHPKKINFNKKVRFFKMQFNALRTKIQNKYRSLFDSLIE